ncbi:hypothetical protein [Brachyspira alvinipulli]|uniref:hypothetical protein n=1 Tax=Brachyspira alvinipulli TaxID=84379 RepID=UPI00048657E0|nr:hypothetical protein [Brachyspira alvinipulli]
MNKKKIISFIALFVVVVLVLWYKAPINGIKRYPEDVSKIEINYNNRNILVTNTNDISLIIKSLNSISLNRSIFKNSTPGYNIKIYSLNDNSILDEITIYSSEVASIGKFFYTDKNNMLPYEYLLKLYSNY